MAGASAKEMASDQAGTQKAIPHQKELGASEVAAKIKAGEIVDYDNVSISGDLDLSHLEGRAKEAVRITNSTFRGSANFEDAAFAELLDLRGTTFEGDCSFARAQLLGDSNFAGTRFSGETDFRLAKFAGLSSFVGAQFFKDASFAYAQFSNSVSFGGAGFRNVSFESVQFLGDAIFFGAGFSGDAVFDFAQVSKLASFWNALFWKEASFTNAQFGGAVGFVNSQFMGNTSFAGARFSSDAVFRSARFSGGAVFGLANFGGFSDFAKAKFGGVAFFAMTKFTDNAYFVDARFDKDLILESARIYSMQLNNVTFGEGSRINLKDADFARFVARWDAIKGRLAFDGAAYLALVKNYKNLEWFDDADSCYYQYRRISQDQEGWGFSKFIDIIAWLSCGYGVRVSYTAFWSVFTILFFGVVYWAGRGMRKFELGRGPFPGYSGQEADQPITLIDALYFSTAMFTTSQAPVNTFPVGHYRHLAMIEGILGWFFLGLFVVVLSGMLIR
jgi:hypothetical protein